MKGPLGFEGVMEAHFSCFLNIRSAEVYSMAGGYSTSTWRVTTRFHDESVFVA